MSCIPGTWIQVAPKKMLQCIYNGFLKFILLQDKIEIHWWELRLDDDIPQQSRESLRFHRMTALASSY